MFDHMPNADLEDIGSFEHARAELEHRTPDELLLELTVLAHGTKSRARGE
jgi:hypothetical protein